MFADLTSLLEGVVTVFHRVPADVGMTEEDMYRPTVYRRVNVQRSDTRTVDADGTVHDSEETEIRIPSDSIDSKALQDDVNQPLDIDTGDIVFVAEIPITGALTRTHVEGIGLPYVRVSALEDLRSDAIGGIGDPLGRYASEVWLTCR